MNREDLVKRLHGIEREKVGGGVGGTMGARQNI